MGAVIGIGFAVFWLREWKLSRDRWFKNPPRNIAGFVIDKYLDHYMSDFTLVMPRAQIFKKLPEPINGDSENVCIWLVEDTEHVFDGVRADRLSWRSLIDWHEGTCFMVFVNGKAATPICGSAGLTPWDALEVYGHMSRQQSEAILGKCPPRQNPY